MSSSDFEYRRARAEMQRGVIEHREFQAGGMECRKLDDGTLRMSGYGSLTESPYQVGNFTEVIRRGAFKRTLSESPDVVLLLNHSGPPMARTKNQSLSLQEDSRGLHWSADLDAEDPDSRALARRVDQGLLDACSFAFLCTDDSWNDDYTERTIKSLSLDRGDVSVVTHAANPLTSVAVGAAEGRARPSGPDPAQRAREQLMLALAGRSTRAVPTRRSATPVSSDYYQRRLAEMKREAA